MYLYLQQYVEHHHITHLLWETKLLEITLSVKRCLSFCIILFYKLENSSMKCLAADQIICLSKKNVTIAIFK